MNTVEVMLKEYETLRQESLNTMSNRNTILSFGLASIGAIFTGSILAYTRGAYPLMSSLALIVLIPFVSSFILVIWLGEYERIQRVGRFLVEVEHKVNAQFSGKLLSWETYLREHRAHMRYPYNATVALLVGISGILFAIGLATANFCTTLIYTISILGVLFHLGLYLFVTFRISRLRM